MPETRLTKTIALLYQMQRDDIRQLEAQILEARKQAWAAALRAEAQAHGCNRVPSAPRREDLDELKRMSKEDAQSITATWNREVTREIERLYAANHRGNRRYYYKNLEAWDAKRREWKLPLIAITTDATTAEYARRRFEKMNYGGGLRYVFAGGVAVCRVCASLFAAGIVDEAFMRRHPLPAHPGCPHQWQVVNRPRMRCDELWLG
jgi:hypothetical protein